VTNQQALVLGGTGLMGSALFNEAKIRGLDPISVARKNADFELDVYNSDDLILCLRSVRPNVVINSFGIADVDFCEEDPVTARLAHIEIPKILDAWCQKNSATYIHISTDQFYGGSYGCRSSEKSLPLPSNEYAKSKLLGEQALHSESHLIIRLSMLGRRLKGSRSLADFMFDTVRSGACADIYTDAITSAIDVKTGASVIFDLFEKSATGVFNVGTHSPYSKSDLFKKIALIDGCLATRARFVEAPKAGVKRNNNLGLCVAKAETMLGYDLPNLEDVVKNLKQIFDCAEARDVSA